MLIFLACTSGFSGRSGSFTAHRAFPMVSSTAISLFAAPEAPPPPVVIVLAATDILPSVHTPLLSQQNIEGQPPALRPEPAQPAGPRSPAPLQPSTRSTTSSHPPPIPIIHRCSPTPVAQVARNGHLQVRPTSRAPTPAAAGPKRLLSVSPGSFQPNTMSPPATSSSPLPMLIEAPNGGASVIDNAVAGAEEEEEEEAEWDDLYVEVPILRRVCSPVVTQQFKYSRPVNSSHTALPKLMTMWSPEFYENWKRSVTAAVEFMVQPVCYGSQTEETKAAMRTAALAVQPLDDFENEWPLERLFFLICKNLTQRVKPKTAQTASIQNTPEPPQRSRVIRYLNDGLFASVCSNAVIQPQRAFQQGHRPLLHRGIFPPRFARERARYDSFLMDEINYLARLGFYKIAPELHPIHPPTHGLDDYDAIDDIEYAHFLQMASCFNLDESAVGLIVHRFNSANGIRRGDLQRLENNSTVCGACKCAFSHAGYNAHIRRGVCRNWHLPVAGIPLCSIDPL
ncbi:hypothetical protein IW261DRAFT_1573225 [Armillaria novae-zelandiae]|uniref:Uncharacterized protein n=1 Tax=Armillaria novae-zelandiae TaxID=153914 RepID=A0AA39NNP8_9AGAR|nr:hypothetical protein IW261DRAFT_1573225 [Armillaria novae-zelandiae]